MIERHYTRPTKAPSLFADDDPWQSLTTAWTATDDHWAAETDESDLPNFSAMPESVFADLLPPPLQEQFQLSQGYVRLIELARHIPQAPRLSMIESLRRSAAEVATLNNEFGTALFLLANAIDNCTEADTHILHRFQELQDSFTALAAKDRTLFLATVEEILEACQSLTK